MSDTYVIAADGIAEVDLTDSKIIRAARMAINTTATRARTAAAREIRQQVNFPASYLTGQDARLVVSRKATDSNLEAIITGRKRATSLARFAKNASPAAAKKKGGITIERTPGQAKFLKGAFFVKLRAGAGRTDTQFNLGLAIRLKPGEKPTGKRSEFIEIFPNVYLLYGASVDQVFRTVREDIAPDATDFLEREFRRLLSLGTV